MSAPGGFSPHAEFGAGEDRPTTPKTAVKMMSMKPFAKLETAVAQPRRRAAAAGLGQMGLVTKAGVVLLR